MKNVYQRMSFQERVRVATYFEEGYAVSWIGRKLSRSKSTISRELGRCREYDPERAEYKAQVRARFRRKWKTKLSRNPRLEAEVIEGLRQRWSPEQISRSLRMKYPEEKQMRISHESIYTYLYVLPRGELRTELFKCLRQKKMNRLAKRRKRAKENGRGKIPEMISIEERPKAVEGRSVPGHWEGDVILGKKHQSVLGTLVERKTRRVILIPLKNKSAPVVRKAFEKAMKDLPRRVALSLTYDQGHEMTQHKLFTKNTKVKVYFCHPASPWERGTCENTNGLIRDYFPKGTDFSKVTKREIKQVQDALNARPRKALGFLTPDEVFAKDILNFVPLKI